MLTRKDIKALLVALLKDKLTDSTVTLDDLNGFFCRELGGGYSGSLVALLWIDQLPTLILKAGPASEILAETEARHQFESPSLKAIRSIGLAGCSEPVEVEVAGRDETWRAMAYSYIGGLSYEDLTSFSDFQAIFEDYVAPQHEDDRPSSQALRSWLNRLCEQIKLRESAADTKSASHGVRAKPLAEFLPDLPWNHGLTAVLQSTAAYAPEPDSLLSFRDWWETTLTKESMAAFPSKTVVHGDLRFANVLVNRTTSDVELIDFGNVTEGHVFRDLARFECDLLFRITPPPVQTRAGNLSSEDRRIRTLEQAFSPDIRQFKDPEDPDNQVTAALSVLREAYDRYWSIGSNHGRRRMYQWFLLAEVLKRMMWSNEGTTTLAWRQALIVALGLLRQGLGGGRVVAEAFGAVAELSRQLNCTALYVPVRGHEATVNRQRNADKIAAMQRAASRGSFVKLLAETGNSYLHFRGPLYPETEALVASGTLQVVLVNPHFIESHGISAAYRDPPGLDDSSVHPLLRQKFAESLAGYDALRSRWRENIQVRVSRYGIGATLLITEEEIFLEPYFRSDRHRRHQRMFETFEFRFSARNSHVRDLLDEHFAFYWANSDPVEGLTAFSSRYKELMQQIGLMWDPLDG